MSESKIFSSSIKGEENKDKEESPLLDK